MTSDPTIQKIENEFQQYVRHVFPGFLSYVSEKRKPYDKILKECFHFYLFSSYLVDAKLFPDDDHLQPLKVLYSKAALALLGIWACLQYGLASEAAILVRALFEVSISVELILRQDVLERLKLYDGYTHVGNWLNLVNNKRLLAAGHIDQKTFDDTFSPERTEEIEKNYNEVRSNYHPKNPLHWAWKVFKDELKGNNPTLRFICDKLGKQLDYFKVYSSLSIAVHGDPHILNLVTIGGTITLTPIFSQHVTRMAAFAIDYCRKIVEQTLKYLAPPHKEPILQYMEIWVDKVIIDAGNAEPPTSA